MRHNPNQTVLKVSSKVSVIQTGTKPVPIYQIMFDKTVLSRKFEDMRNRKGTREGSLSGIFAITELDQELLGLSNDPREIIANPNILMMT